MRQDKDREKLKIPEEVVATLVNRVYSEYHLDIAWSDAEAMIRDSLMAWPGIELHKVQVPDDSDDVRYTLKTKGILLPIEDK